MAFTSTPMAAASYFTTVFITGSVNTKSPANPETGRMLAFTFTPPMICTIGQIEA
jgi:hypothetical protein